jgi:hypothetical protein
MGRDDATDGTAAERAAASDRGSPLQDLAPTAAGENMCGADPADTGTTDSSTSGTGISGTGISGTATPDSDTTATDMTATATATTEGDTTAGSPRHDVLSGIDQIEVGVGRVLAASAWTLTDAQVRESLVAVSAAVAQAEAARLALIRVLDERPGSVPGAQRGREAATFLVHRLRVDPGRAAADVAAAHALDPTNGTLRGVGAALAAGEISRDHAGVCVRAAARLPKRLAEILLPDTDPDVGAETGADVGAQPAADPDDPVDDPADDPTDGAADSAGDGPRLLTGMQVADRWLAQQARLFRVREVGRLADQLIARLAPEQADRFDPDAHLRRGVSFVRDSTGMGLLRMQATPADAVLLDALLAAVSAPTPAVLCPSADGSDTDNSVSGGDGSNNGADGGESDGERLVRVRDDRSRAARMYDGLMGVLRAGMTSRAVVAGAAATADARAAGQSEADQATAAARADQTAAASSRRSPGTDSTDVPADGAPDTDVRAANAPATDVRDADPPAAGPTNVDIPAAFAATPTPPVTVLITATVEQLVAAGLAASEATGRADGFGSAANEFDSAAHGVTRVPAGLAHVQHTGPVSADLLAMLSCTATLQRVLLAPSGAPLDVGRSQRLATPAQRRALAARDGGCVIPGCGCPHEGTDIHHLHAWSTGGSTDLENLVSLCPAHHQQVHAGTWQIRMIDGVPWVRPPHWVDPQRRLLRNPFHQHARAASRIGQQLQLALDDHDASTGPPGATRRPGRRRETPDDP